MKPKSLLTWLVLCLGVLSSVSSVSAQQQSVILNNAPSRTLGHPQFKLVTTSPNLVEGREMSTPQGLAIDTSGSGVLYVADTGNNRVLVWKNPLAAANGAPADLVIGQPDKYTTNAQGPGTNFTRGLSQPTGLAVDASGNLWIADSGNNRVLRFPKPVDNPEPDFMTPDIIIGQLSLRDRTANQGNPTPSLNSLYLADSNSAFRAGLTLDSAGNLYVSDAGNHRVLRFPSSVLTPGNFGPGADAVLGQIDFESRKSIDFGNGSGRLVKNGFNLPDGITASSDNRLYVADGLGRVLVFRLPLQTAQPADRILGILVVANGQPAPPPVNDTQLGSTLQSRLQSPSGTIMDGVNPIVIDTAANRLVRYEAPDAWPAETALISPKMRDVIGQVNFTDGKENEGANGTNAGGLNQPSAGAVFNGNLFVADPQNNRVVVIPAPFTGNATKVFGQTGLDLNAPNQVEGREFFLTGIYQGRTVRAGGVALDGNILYVADTLNNRVLGFRDVRTVRAGQTADLVIGQVSLDRTLVNSPANNQNVPSDSGLFQPYGVAVDGQGNLWVADTANSRVLRFPKPFDQAPGTTQKPNLVIGQLNLTSKITDATSRTMSAPVAIAFTFGGNLLVSDAAHNRVLYFVKPNNGDFSNGQAAANVFGQPDFSSVISNNLSNRMTGPRGIAVDVDDRLYVVDTGNNRVHIYNRVTLAGTDPAPALTLGGLFNSPQGICTDPRTAEIWVADTNNNRAVRFPAYGQLIVNQTSNLVVQGQGPLDLRVDSLGNLVMADSANRVSFYYQAQVSINAANFQTQQLAPGMIASMFAQGGTFTDAIVSASSVPLPTEMNDTQVLFNDEPVRLFYVSPGQINYLVPMNAPTSGIADLTVLRKSTGQVIAAGVVGMRDISPGFFTTTSTGRGQVSALNQDNTVNGPDNRESRGRSIQLFGTGQGFIPGAPPDGTPPDRAYDAVDKPDVLLNGRAIGAENVTYSGLAPGLVGVWQVNVKIPDFVAPGSVSLLIQLRSAPSQVQLGTIISVKQ